MDILDKSLYNYLKQNGFPKLNAAKEMMVKLLIGLEHMHKKGYMHRDLKL
jgi:serine/threonine protein kinase